MTISQLIQEAEAILTQVAVPDISDMYKVLADIQIFCQGLNDLQLTINGVTYELNQLYELAIDGLTSRMDNSVLIRLKGCTAFLKALPEEV